MLWDYAAADARPDPSEGTDLPATFGETFSTAWSDVSLAVNGMKQANARDQAIGEYTDKIKQAGGNVDAEYAKQMPQGAFGEAPFTPDAFDVANGVVQGMKANGKPLPFQEMSSADIDARAAEISRQAIAANSAMMGREQSFGSRAGSILGSLAAQATDLYNIPLLAVPTEGLGILGAAAVGAGAVAATQTANEAVNFGYNQKIMPGYSAADAGRNILEAGAGGALLGAGGALVGKALGAVAGRMLPTSVRDAAHAAESEHDILGSNPLPGAEGEAAHRTALGKAVGDILKEEPVDVSKAIPEGSVLEEHLGSAGGETSGPLPTSENAPTETETGAELRPVAKPAPAEEGPLPATMAPEEIGENLAAPETHDAMRADVERLIDEHAQTGNVLQFPDGVDANGDTVMTSAARALGDVDRMNELAAQIGQCALPQAMQQAAE